MLSLIATPGTPESTRLEDRRAPEAGTDVLVRTIEIGVCGTDREIHAGQLGSPPPGRESLVLGHEVLGRVERDAGGFQRGELVVATVRRPCGRCANCAAGDLDVCTTGEMPERGIHRADGFGSELFVEQRPYLLRVPKQIAPVGILTEPTSVCERALRHSLAVGHRQPWQPRRAVVLGAGPIGILTTLLLRLADLDVWTLSGEAESSVAADLVRRSDARYVSLAAADPGAVAIEIEPDLLIEATGDAEVVHRVIGATARNGVVCLVGVDGRNRSLTVDSTVLGRDYVSGNRVLIGSVNAARDDWPQAIRDLVAIDLRFPGLLRDLITRRESPDQFAVAFQPGGVKSTIVFESGVE